MPSARFRPADRVVSARDYARVRSRGRRLASKHFAVSIAAHELVPSSEAARRCGERQPSRNRLGLAVSRRVGKAVVRNRVKRAIREWFRTSRSRLPDDVDIVVVARRGAGDRQPLEIARELDTLLAGRCPAQRKSRSLGEGESGGHG